VGGEENPRPWKGTLCLMAMVAQGSPMTYRRGILQQPATEYCTIESPQHYGILQGCSAIDARFRYEHVQPLVASGISTNPPTGRALIQHPGRMPP